MSIYKENDLNIFVNEKSIASLAENLFQGTNFHYEGPVDVEKYPPLKKMFRSLKIVLDVNIDKINDVKLLEAHQSGLFFVNGNVKLNGKGEPKIGPTIEFNAETNLKTLEATLEWVVVGKELCPQILTLTEPIMVPVEIMGHSTTFDLTDFVIEQLNIQLKENDKFHIKIPQMPFSPNSVSQPEWRIQKDLFLVGTCIGNEMPDKKGVKLEKYVLEAKYDGYEIGTSFNDRVLHAIIDPIFPPLKPVPEKLVEAN